MKALPECEVISNIQDTMDIMPKSNLFNHYYHNLTHLTVPETFKYNRSYEGCSNYLIVFAPITNHIDSKQDIKKIEKYLRSKYHYQRILLTREILESRIHYNVLLTTKSNPILTNNTIVQKFHLNVQHVPNITHLPTIIQYMFKESKHRPFHPNIDYFLYTKNIL